MFGTKNKKFKAKKFSNKTNLHEYSNKKKANYKEGDLKI